jgi:hypothetical protein
MKPYDAANNILPWEVIQERIRTGNFAGLRFEEAA